MSVLLINIIRENGVILFIFSTCEWNGKIISAIWPFNPGNRILYFLEESVTLKTLTAAEN
jgi:hypothetical protein